MEPIEIGLVAIAVPFLTKYVEKTGEGLGEKTLEQVDKFWQLIQRKPVEILSALKFAETEAFPVDFERAIQELEVANKTRKLSKLLLMWLKLQKRKVQNM